MSDSEYFSKLSVESKLRYKEKISKINDIDPYTLNKNDFRYHEDFYPNTNGFDIATYLLHATCPVTQKEMLNYRSMESFNQFHCGWVKEIGVKHFSPSICLVQGRVS